MLLMIDNYDSFTYNVVQYLGELGAEVKVVRNDELTVAQIAALNPERIVVSPGPCTPTEAGISLEAIKYFAGKLPILGVCLGHQSIGQALRNLNGLNASIASATLQQAHVVEDINQNVTQAAGLSHSTALAAEQSSVASAHLKGLSEQLDGLLRQFKV